MEKAMLERLGVGCVRASDFPPTMETKNRLIYIRRRNLRKGN